MGIINKIKQKLNKSQPQRITMITERGNGIFAWDGKLYQSDLIRSAIKPHVTAVGKLTAKHIRRYNGKIEVNPEPYLRFLFEEPNPLMTFQVMMEKVDTQLALNNNAFILIIRDECGIPMEFYPIPAVTAEAIYIDSELHLKFTFANGKTSTFPYSDIIHLRQDFDSNDVFGTPPGSALTQLMDIVTASDQSIVNAIKNSAIVRWILKYARMMREDDLKDNVQSFVDNYLSIESSTMGAAGVSGEVDIQRVEPKDYVPNASLQKYALTRLHSFFGTNEKIVQSNYTDDEWNAYYEAKIEPIAMQCNGEFTRKIFTRRERGFGNSIEFGESNLTCASLKTKLELQAMVDRGALTPNEWRATFNLPPVTGGDEPIRRLDTATVVEGGEENDD